MKAKTINPDEIRDLLVESLPTHPTAPAAFGGRGYTASEMKAAFDKLPLFLVDRINDLLSDVESRGADSLAGAVPTGIDGIGSLADLFDSVENGVLAASILLASGESIAAALDALNTRIARLEAQAT